VVGGAFVVDVTVVGGETVVVVVDVTPVVVVIGVVVVVVVVLVVEGGGSVVVVVVVVVVGGVVVVVVVVVVDGGGSEVVVVVLVVVVGGAGSVKQNVTCDRLPGISALSPSPGPHSPFHGTVVSLPLLNSHRNTSSVWALVHENTPAVTSQSMAPDTFVSISPGVPSLIWIFQYSPFQASLAHSTLGGLDWASAGTTNSSAIRAMTPVRIGPRLT
jgi:hypothetical protein